MNMLEYKFDTQLLIEGNNLSEDEINDYIESNIEGDCLLAVGDENLIKIHFHTNTPWKVLEYCASKGDIHDVVIENMDRQAKGLQGQPQEEYMEINEYQKLAMRTINKDLSERDMLINGVMGLCGESGDV